jgi:CYTH domain-containing protein
MIAAEIERKFILDSAPEWLTDHPADEIHQGYLAIVGGEREVRVRTKGSARVLTVKVGSGREREEVEIELTQEQFDELWPLTEGARVEKTRYRVPSGDLTIEIDVFGNALNGMVMAEIEFESTAQSEEFEPPEWLGSEVTGDHAYENESLALHGRPGGSS